MGYYAIIGHALAPTTGQGGPRNFQSFLERAPGISRRPATLLLEYLVEDGISMHVVGSGSVLGSGEKEGILQLYPGGLRISDPCAVMSVKFEAHDSRHGESI